MTLLKTGLKSQESKISRWNYKKKPEVDLSCQSNWFFNYVPKETVWSVKKDSQVTLVAFAYTDIPQNIKLLIWTLGIAFTCI